MHFRGEARTVSTLGGLAIFKSLCSRQFFVTYICLYRVTPKHSKNGKYLIFCYLVLTVLFWMVCNLSFSVLLSPNNLARCPQYMQHVAKILIWWIFCNIVPVILLQNMPLATWVTFWFHKLFIIRKKCCVASASKNMSHV